MALPATIETADSWQHFINADGNEEFSLVFYATWGDAYGPRGPGFRFAEIGDILITAGGIEDDRLRLTSINVSPTTDDKDGCRYEQVYTSNNMSLQLKQANLRNSWRSSFSTSMETDNVDQQINSAEGTFPGDYSGDATTDLDINDIPKQKLVFVPRTIYRVSYAVTEVDITVFQSKMGRVNSDFFFNRHKAITSGDTRIRDAESKWTFIDRPAAKGDLQQWLFFDFGATQTGINNYEVSMEFHFEQNGWNGPIDTSGVPTGDTFYLETPFEPLFAQAKVEARPNSSLAGRT